VSSTTAETMALDHGHQEERSARKMSYKTTATPLSELASAVCSIQGCCDELDKTISAILSPADNPPGPTPSGKRSSGSFASLSERTRSPFPPWALSLMCL
jgi:hypothetical protein